MSEESILIFLLCLFWSIFPSFVFYEDLKGVFDAWILDQWSNWNIFCHRPIQQCKYQQHTLFKQIYILNLIFHQNFLISKKYQLGSLKSSNYYEGYNSQEQDNQIKSPHKLSLSIYSIFKKKYQICFNKYCNYLIGLTLGTNMCQCILCDCCWCNCCGVCCAGYHAALLCFSCWLCKTGEMQMIDPECCHCGEWTGYGSNQFYLGYVCCAPDYVVKYSQIMEKPVQQRFRILSQGKQHQQTGQPNQQSGTSLNQGTGY